MILSANWSYPTAVRFGPGRIAELAASCRTAGIARPLLVTDRGLSRLPMIAHARDLCREASLTAAVFEGVQPNPVESNVQDGVRAFRDGGHDGVIAMGGGSALDCGKLIAFMVGQTRPIWDFEDIGDWWTRADAAGIAPIIAVPTTAGTGSEVGRAGVVTDEATHTKKIIFHPKMMPSISICDPELTIELPRPVTAGTGMDALAHCLEAYCAPGFHPLADGIAAEGVRLALTYLPRAVADGTDIEARAQMMAAAAMGATAFQKGLGAMHSLSHPIGAICGTHHGMTNAVFMPYVLAFNRAAITERIERLAAYCGMAPSFEAFLQRVLDLRRDIGVPDTIRELGVDFALADRIAQMAIVDPTAGGNPVTLTREGARAIFEAAYAGQVR
jgi:alcohol dehydrogenase class IV